MYRKVERLGVLDVFTSTCCNPNTLRLHIDIEGSTGPSGGFARGFAAGLGVKGLLPSALVLLSN